MNEERLRSGEFINTYEIVKDLEFCEPQAFPLLFAYKMKTVLEQNAESEEIIADFRTGKSDPSTLVWQEKLRRQLETKKRAK